MCLNGRELWGGAQTKGSLGSIDTMCVCVCVCVHVCCESVFVCMCVCVCVCWWFWRCYLMQQHAVVHGGWLVLDRRMSCPPVVCAW